MNQRRGLTLIELLIAMALSGLVAFMAFDLFHDEHANYTTTREKIKLQADAREGVRLIEEEIKNLGFKTRTTLSGTTVTVSKCSETQYATTKASFASPVVSSLEFRFFNPFENFQCAETDLWTIGYRLNGTVLERKANRGGGVSGYTNATWVPFLNGVKSFSVQYGIYSDATEMITIADQTAASPSTLFSLTAPVQISVDQTSATSRPWTVSNWTTSVGNASLLKNLTLDNKSTYRISFWADGSPSFMDQTDGATGIKIILAPTLGGANVEIPFAPGAAGAPRFIQYEFSPPVAGTYRVGISARMQTVPSNPAQCVLILSGIQLKRVSRGTYSSWVDQSTTPTPSWETVGAVRILFNVEGKNKENLSFDRIIPAVNNVF